jgi:hypothetical protein
VGGSTQCFDPFIPGEQWIGCLLGHANGLDILEQWIGACCQCITMNTNWRHKEKISKITLLGVKSYTFYDGRIFSTTSYIEFMGHFRLLTRAPVRKICNEHLELAS